MWKQWRRVVAIVGVVGATGMTPSAVLAQVTPDTVVSQLVTLRVETLRSDLVEPVAMAFLSDGTAILAQRSAGTFSLFDPTSATLTELGGLPDILTEGDGGVLDVALHPDFADNGWIYLSYSVAVDTGSVTVLDRARLEGQEWVDRERLFTATPPAPDPAHFGGRIAFHEGYVFLTVGDRQPRALPSRESAQSLATHNGTIVRLLDDGTVPNHNPFVGVPGARPEVWSFGHRNPQGMAVNPQSRTLWSHEHGPQGGDEINVVRGGENYGWPVVTYGEEYGGGPVGEGRVQHPGMAPPLYFFRPSIAPSDLVFVSGKNIEAWSGSALIGALGMTHLNRLTLDGDRVLHEERLLEELGWRIRMIEEGPDGQIYLGTDSGLLVRLSALRQ